MFASIIQRFKRLGFRARLQQEFLEDLKELLSDGIPLRQGLQIITQDRDDIVKSVGETMLLKISQGQYMADGMQPWFPSFITEVVRAGEESGTLIETLNIASDMASQREIALSTVLSALTYPMIVLIIGMIVMIFVDHSIFVNFREIKPMSQWPASGQYVAMFAGFIERWWWLILLLVLGMIGLIALLMHNSIGKIRLWLDELPFFMTYRRVVSARFMQVLGLLVTNGIVLKKALKILQNNASPYLSWHLLSMEHRLGAGAENIADVLDTGLLEKSDLLRLRVIAHGQGFANALSRQGRRSVKHAEESITRTARMTGVALLIGAAFLALFLVLGIYNTGSIIAAYPA